jgi:hypothetical protein
MDERLQSVLDFSNYQQTFAIQRKILKEKVNAKLTYGTNGGIFFIDRTLLSFVDMLLSKSLTNAVLMDTNANPVFIENLNEFKDEIFSRYFEATNEYYLQYQELKKSRSVSKLIDL